MLYFYARLFTFTEYLTVFSIFVISPQEFGVEEEEFVDDEYDEYSGFESSESLGCAQSFVDFFDTFCIQSSTDVEELKYMFSPPLVGKRGGLMQPKRHLIAPMDHTLQQHALQQPCIGISDVLTSHSVCAFAGRSMPAADFVSAPYVGSVHRTNVFNSAALDVINVSGMSNASIQSTQIFPSRHSITDFEALLSSPSSFESDLEASALCYTDGRASPPPLYNAYLRPLPLCSADIDTQIPNSLSFRATALPPLPSSVDLRASPTPVFEASALLPHFSDCSAHFDRPAHSHASVGFRGPTLPSTVGFRTHVPLPPLCSFGLAAPPPSSSAPLPTSVCVGAPPPPSSAGFRASAPPFSVNLCLGAPAPASAPLIAADTPVFSKREHLRNELVGKLYHITS